MSACLSSNSSRSSPSLQSCEQMSHVPKNTGNGFGSIPHVLNYRKSIGKQIQGSSGALKVKYKIVGDIFAFPS